MKVTGLATDRVTYFKLGAVKSATGGALYDNEAWYTLNQMSGEASSIASDRTKQDPDWAGRVKYGRNPGRGWWAEVDLEGAYTVTLRALDGSEVKRQAGSGAGSFNLAATAPGLYLLEIAQGGQSLVRKLAL